MRPYHFFMKFMRSFSLGLGIGTAAAAVLFSLLAAVLRIRMGL